MTERKRIRVRDVMKRHFDTVDGMATIREAMQEMKHVANKSLIVNKRHEHDEVGILLISDVARKVLAEGRSPDRVNVYEVATKPVIHVHPDMDIRYCARLFDRFGLTRAPVIDDGEVIGIVSLTDLVLRGLVQLD
jgi:signal-transduction protein with cAMP-binding, CBS, and nucleotidyltransferase domain